MARSEKSFNWLYAESLARNCQRISVRENGGSEVPVGERLKNRHKREPFSPDTRDWTGKSGFEVVPEFLKPGLSLREVLRGSVDFEVRPKGREADGYQPLLDRASQALRPQLKEIVRETRGYRKQLGRELKAMGLKDGENLDDKTFFKLLATGDVLNYCEDFRLKKPEDYLKILSISQSVRLTAVEIINSWAQRGLISPNELASLGMTKEELAVVTNFELQVGPYLNAIFNKSIYQQAVLGKRSPGKDGERIFNEEVNLGKIFVQTWSETRDGKTEFYRPSDYISPEWLQAARQIKLFAAQAKEKIPPEIWQKNWGQGFDKYFDQLDVVMRSTTLDREKIDREYDKLLKIAREYGPDYQDKHPFDKPFLRFVVLPPTVENNGTLAQDYYFRSTWYSDKDVALGVKYDKMRELVQQKIKQVIATRPELIASSRDKLASQFRPATLLSVSGGISESRMSGARGWPGWLELYPEMIDWRTVHYRWPLLARMGLVEKGNRQQLAALKESVRLYFAIHEAVHGLIPENKRPILEELKADLYGLAVLIQSLGGIDEIPTREVFSLVLAIVSEDWYNIGSSSEELNSLGSLYLVPAILRMNRLMRSRSEGRPLLRIRNDGTIKLGDQEKILLELAGWGKKIMNENFLWAHVKAIKPSDRQLLKRTKVILSRNHLLRGFVSETLPELFKEIDGTKVIS